MMRVDSYQINTLLVLVCGITTIAIALGFGFALTVEQIRAREKKPQAAGQQTSHRFVEKEEVDMA
jgi:hypothetical protein